MKITDWYLKKMSFVTEAARTGYLQDISSTVFTLYLKTHQLKCLKAYCVAATIAVS